MKWYPPSPSCRAMRVIILGLLLSVNVVVPTARAQEPLVEISIEEVTSEQGLVLVTGTVTCSEPTAFTDVSVEVRQPIGRFRSIRGFAFDSLGPCADELPFSLGIVPESGRFKQGTAFILANTFACDEEFNFCDDDSAFLAIRLRK